mgnify:FL=1
MKDTEIALQELKQMAVHWLKNYGNFSENEDFSSLAKGIIELVSGESEDFDKDFPHDPEKNVYVFETNQTVIYTMVRIQADGYDEALQMLRGKDPSIKYSNFISSDNRDTIQI